MRDADTFIRLHFSNGEMLDVTPHHIFTLADGSPMRAERLCLSDILVGRFGRVTMLRIETIVESAQKVTISCAPYQQFFAGHYAASVLTHNYTFTADCRRSVAQRVPPTGGNVKMTPVPT